ncbi:hypothetical protein OIU79_029099 [Salix purpurea]|uniref:Uncharacterized protein n=1 Tax=Salix purpurea TaxID=77065 RepID=A0A9Q0VY36_SALPP|nr:hypothetical protein OIU79_029099 [Salix purpurea]
MPSPPPSKSSLFSNKIRNSPWSPQRETYIQVMEQERKKKRGRDQEEAERKEESSNKSSKMQADHHPSHPRSVRNDIKTERRSCDHEEDSTTSNEISGDNNFALGVFDFPWLKEGGGGGGMISKADEEEWCLEDTVFSSSLHYGAASAADQFSGQHLWETTTCIGSCMDVPVDKFEEINAWSLEMEERTVD